MAGSSSNNEEQSSGQDNRQLAVELALKPECPADLDLRSLPHSMALEIYKELNEDDKYITVAEYVAPIIHYDENWIKSLAIPNFREPHKTPAQRLIEEMNCKGGDVAVLLRVLSDLNMLGALNVICQPVPFRIIRHPNDAFGRKRRKIYVHHGETISIKCEAFGLPPPQYQWYFNDEALVGQTREILTLTMTKSSQAGIYQCSVRQVDQQGAITREQRSRQLKIDMSPIAVRVTEQPLSCVQVDVGGTVQISCGAIGYPDNLLFQWYRNNDLICSHYPDKDAAPENNDDDEPKAWNYSRSVLQIENCEIEDTALYTCRVSNSVSDDHSNQAHVWVSSPLPILRGKVALVIANQQYKYHQPLATAKADAKLVAMALQGIGFTVMVFEDLTRQQMIKAFEIFGTFLNDGCYGFLYYVGHGYRIQENYILPIDAPEYFDHSHDISESTLLSHTLVGDPALLVTVLDMCQDSIDPKDNPELYRDPPTIGWSNEVGIQWNLLQAYSTSYYRPAFEDTESDNGIYASSLGSLLPLEDVPVNQLFEKLGQKVGLAMRGKLHYQIPMYSTSVTQPFKLIDLPKPKNVCVKIKELSKRLRFPADFVVDLKFAPEPVSGQAHIKLHMEIFQNSIVVQLKDLVEPWDKASIVNASDESTRDIARVLNDNTWYINNPRGALLVKIIYGKNDVATAVLDVLAYLPRIILDLNEISPDEMIVPFKQVKIPRPPPAPHTIAPPTRENGCAIWANAMTSNTMPAPDHWSHSDEENVTNGAYSQGASNWASESEWSSENEEEEQDDDTSLGGLQTPKVELNNGGAEADQVDNASLGEVETPSQSPENIKRMQWKDKSSPMYMISNNYLVLTPSNDVPILAENNAGSVDQVQQLPTNSADKPEQLPELNGSTTAMTNRSNDYQNFTPIHDPQILTQNDAKSVDESQLPSNSSDKPKIVPKLKITAPETTNGSAPEITNGSAPEITNGSNAYQNLTPIRDPRISAHNDARSVDQAQKLPTNSTVTPKILPKLQSSAPEIAKGSTPEITNGSNAYQNLTPIHDPRISAHNDARSINQVPQLPPKSTVTPKILPKLQSSAPEMAKGSTPEVTNGSNAYQNLTPIRDPRISTHNDARSINQVHQLPTKSTVTPKIVPKLQSSAPEITNGSAPEITNGSNAYQNLTPIRDPRISAHNDARSINQVPQLPPKSTVTPKIVPKLQSSAPEITNGSAPEITNGSNAYQNLTPIHDPRISAHNDARSINQVHQLPTKSTVTPKILPKLQSSAPEITNGSAPEITNGSNAYQNLTPIHDPRISAHNDARSVDQAQKLPTNSTVAPKIVPKLQTPAPEMAKGSTPEITNDSNAYQNLTPIRDPRISAHNDARSINQVHQLPTKSTVIPKIVPKLQSSAPEITNGSVPEVINGSNAYQNLTPIRDPRISAHNDARLINQVPQLPPKSTVTPKIVPKLQLSAPEITNGSAPEITNGSNAYQNLTPIHDPRISTHNDGRSINQVHQLPTKSTVTPKILPKLQSSAPEMAKGSTPEVTNGSNAYQNLTPIRDPRISAHNDARSINQVHQLPTKSTVIPKIVPKLQSSAPEITNGSVPEVINGSNACQNLTPIRDPRISAHNDARLINQVPQLPPKSTVTPKIVPKLQLSAPEITNGSAPEITNGSNAYQNLTPIHDPRISAHNDARLVNQVPQLPPKSTVTPKVVPKLQLSAPEMAKESTPEVTNGSNAYQNLTPIHDPRISTHNDGRSINQVHQLPTKSTVTPKIVPKLQSSAPEMAKRSTPEVTNGSNAYQNLTPIHDPRISAHNDARSINQVPQLPPKSTVTPKILPKLQTSAPEKTNGSILERTNGSAPKMTNGSNGHQNSAPTGDVRILPQNNARSVNQAYKSLYESPHVTTLPPKGKPLTLPPNNKRSVNQTLQIPQNANEMPSRSPTLASPLTNAGSVIHPQLTPPNPNEMPNPSSRLNRSPSVMSMPLSSNSTTLTPSKIMPIDKLLPSPGNPDDMRNASQRYAESSPIVVRRMWSGGNVTVTPIATPIPSPRDSPMTPINIFTSNLVSLNLTPSNSSTQNAVIEQTPPPITEMTPVFVNRMSGGSVTISPVETPTEESKSIALSTSSDLPASSSKDTESVDQPKKPPQNLTLSPKIAESVDQTEKLPQTSTDTPKRSSIFGKVVRKVSWGSDSTPKNTESVDQTKKSPQNSIDTPKRSSIFGKVVKKVSRGSDSTPKNEKSVDKVKKSPQKSNGSPGLNGSPPATRSPSNDL
ncbi:hypothetical protein TKK_0002672 [Trichogramma kaykai]|uniref:Uncharacterized protein n=1 Tax=Trichogramma kaykai TaxID=54128 RepID=A0ABD2XTH0_9HYME